jgi:hypothetical protein
VVEELPCPRETETLLRVTSIALGACDTFIMGTFPRDTETLLRVTSIAWWAYDRIIKDAFHIFPAPPVKEAFS